MSGIRLLVSDDHRLFREGVCQILRNIGGFVIVGEADNGRTAVELTRELSPDIVLMDINMPVLDGVKATRLITEQSPSVSVVILTMYHEETYVFEAIKAGARGYLLKSMSGDELITGLNAVWRGEGIMSPELAGKLLNEFRRINLESEETTDNRGLTSGEMAVLQLLAQGEDNRRIAQQLDISIRTVANRVSEILEKLHVNNRTKAALVALREGWANLTPDS